VEAARGTAFMLDDGSGIRIVRIGDAIGNDYRVEKFQGGQLVFRYRPMNVLQTLAVGNPS